MAFPDIQPDGNAVRVAHRRFENRRQGKSGGVQISRPHNKLQRVVTIAWSLLTGAELDQVLDYLSSASAFFYFFLNRARSISERSFGTGNGSTSTFTLPAKEVSATGLVIKIAGATTTAYTLNAGTGAEGEDQIVFNTPPANGAALTWSATSARERIQVYVESGEWSEGLTDAEIFALDDLVLAEAI